MITICWINAPVDWKKSGLLIELPALPDLVAGLLELLQHSLDEVTGALIEPRNLLGEETGSLQTLKRWLDELRDLPEVLKNNILVRDTVPTWQG